MIRAKALVWRKIDDSAQVAFFGPTIAKDGPGRLAYVIESDSGAFGFGLGHLWAPRDTGVELIQDGIASLDAAKAACQAHADALAREIAEVGE